jgi:hypothetical protein
MQSEAKTEMKAKCVLQRGRQADRLKKKAAWSGGQDVSLIGVCSLGKLGCVSLGSRYWELCHQLLPHLGLGSS